MCIHHSIHPDFRKNIIISETENIVTGRYTGFKNRLPLSSEKSLL